jgi:mRNA interferase YafQ
MLAAKRTNRFKKEFALAEKRGRDMGEIIAVMDMLINEQPLPERCYPHPLHGKWEGCIDCHILNDWVLIYEIDLAAKIVTFHRTGSHSDLF